MSSQLSMVGTQQLEEKIKIYGFERVTNIPLLLELLRDEIRCAIVDLSTICSLFHLKSAALKALLNEQQGHMKTKSLSAEILYQLSPTTKINDSIKHYGASQEATNIAIIVIDDDAVGLDLLASVEGISLDLNLLGAQPYLSLDKAANIAKFFKITAQELEISSLEAAVITRLATKDCL